MIPSTFWEYDQACRRIDELLQEAEHERLLRQVEAPSKGWWAHISHLFDNPTRSHQHHWTLGWHRK